MVESYRNRMKRIAILGSTGSIGTSALSVVDAHADRLAVVGLAAGENADRLAEQIARYRPRTVSMASGAAIDRLREAGSVDAGVVVGTAQLLRHEGSVRIVHAENDGLLVPQLVL